MHRCLHSPRCVIRSRELSLCTFRNSCVLRQGSPFMKQVLIRRGEAVADDVPAPALEAGTALVAVQRSCISVGTELSGLKRSGLPLWQLAARYPEHAKKVIQTVATMGVNRTWNIVQGQLSAGTRSEEHTSELQSHSDLVCRLL